MSDENKELPISFRELVQAYDIKFEHLHRMIKQGSPSELMSAIGYLHAAVNDIIRYKL